MIDGKAKSHTVPPTDGDQVIPSGKTAHDSTGGGKANDALSHLQELEQQVKELREAELRSKADYQNLVRRTQDERSKLVKLAALGLIEDLIQPLDHLQMAAEQLKDAGLNMVTKQFWQVLEQHGLERLDVQGQAFDPHTMEAIEKNGDTDLVTRVVAAGYRLNGDVIRPAKVVVGETDQSNS